MRSIIIILFLGSIFSCSYKTAEDHYKNAKLFETKGDYENAIKELNIVLKKQPKNIYALLDRGIDHSLLNQYQEAVNDYSKVISIDSNNA